jgi:drug/metabolite transporter (DMT)-like permease
MTWTYDVFALAAAGCWALGSTLSVTPSRHLGAIAYARWRLLVVASMLWVGTLLWNGLPALASAQVWPLALSGLVGIFIGDSVNYAAMNRLGPRRTGVLFATHAVFSVVLGNLLLGERMTLQAMLGSALTLGGVMTAIAFGRRDGDKHEWEATRDRLGVGVLLGLAAGLCQALGTLLAKPVMASGVSAIEASAVRVSVACVAHVGLVGMSPRLAGVRAPMDIRTLAQTSVSSLIGIGVGMTLLLVALGHGDVGTVAVLSSVTPIFVLPVLWFALRRPPARGAWLGAILTVLGTVLIVSR